MPNSLEIVRKFHPNVKTVKDAKSGMKIEVTAKDIKAANTKSHRTCALAVACKRAKHLDGVIISRAVAYLVRGDEATRYMMTPAASREIVAFDRGGSFEPGVYSLVKPHESIAIGTGRQAPRGSGNGNGKRRSPRHITGNIRAVLAGQAK